MTTTVLGSLITENGSSLIQVAFTDATGTAVTPTSATWTLSTSAGEPINNRTDVVIGSLSTSVDIVLSGDDLAIGENGIDRILTVEWVYNSSIGDSLPGKAELYFALADLVNVP